jgi:hypothetical protein
MGTQIFADGRRKVEKESFQPKTQTQKMNLPFSRVQFCMFIREICVYLRPKKLFYFNQGGSWNFVPAMLAGQTILLFPSTI